MFLYPCNHIFTSLMLRFLFLTDKRYWSSHVYIPTWFLQFFKISHVSISNSFPGYLFWQFFFFLLFFLVEQQQKSEDGQETRSLSPHHGFNKSQLNDCPRDSGCYISSENSDNGKEEVDPETLSDMVQSITITESNWFSPAAFLHIFRKNNQSDLPVRWRRSRTQNIHNTENRLLSDVRCSRLFNMWTLAS